jgi:hypothetical protein
MPETDQKSRSNLWRKHIKGWGISELSKTKYCEENKISKSAFYTWMKKLNIFKKDNRFIPITIESKNNKAGNYCTIDFENSGKIIIEKKEVITEILKIMQMVNV